MDNISEVTEYLVSVHDDKNKWKWSVSVYPATHMPNFDPEKIARAMAGGLEAIGGYKVTVEEITKLRRRMDE